MQKVLYLAVDVHEFRSQLALHEAPQRITPRLSIMRKP